MVFSAALAFLLVQALDESEPLGNSALVYALDSDNSVNSTQVIQAITSFSHEHHVVVAREISDLHDPDGLRHLYMTSGATDATAADWLKKGYPEFSRNYKTRVHPISEIAQRDPRGMYYVFGSSEAGVDLKSELDGLGLVTSVSHPLSYSELADQYSGDPLLLAFYAVALAALTLTGASVLLSAKSYGVLRMQGMSLADILIRDLRQLVLFWFLTAGIVGSAALAFLGFYNGLAWLGLFASIAAGIAALLTTVVLVTHAAALALTSKVGILRALKGELPSRSASVSVYLVRIPALLLTLSIATDVTLAARDVMARQENRGVYQEVGDAVSLRLSGAYAAHLDEMDRRLGPWLRNADRKGEVIVAGRRDLQISAPGANLPSGEFLIVNDTYLSKQPVFDPAGRRYESEAASAKVPDSRPVRLIIPESLGPHSQAIAKAASQIIDPAQRRNIPTETLKSRVNQRLFGYNSGAQVYNSAYGPTEDRSFVRNPILIVVPNGSRFLTNDAYDTYASQDGVIFPDPDDAFKSIEAQKLQTYITAVSPVGQKVARDYKNSVGELRLQIFNLIAAMVVLLVAGVGICIIYSRKNAQSIFAQHVSGWRYVATHRFILAVEVAIAAVFATRVPFEAWQQNRELDKFAASGAPAPFQPTHITALDLGVITSIVVLELGAVLIALAFFHRRVIKEAAAA
ncbi:bacteriocin-associated integral membrane family protein [Streptomyces rishiriensis]|uniref:bacteriocin-associated integral membrane family protein n=1 Tax=Streptomyces rishiriensis TaxID=68264 RepID=UPI00131F1BE9|nr:hypothetical protein [Streptomyces rishiriensis]